MGMRNGHTFNKGGNSCKRQLIHRGKRTTALPYTREHMPWELVHAAQESSSWGTSLVFAKELSSHQESRTHISNHLLDVSSSPKENFRDFIGRCFFHLESWFLKGKCIITFLTIWSLKYFSSFLCKVNHLVFQVWEKK